MDKALDYSGAKATRIVKTRVRRIASATEPGSGEETVSCVIAIELVAAALAAGSPIPRAFEVVGSALPRESGQPLVIVGRALMLGASWREAWLDGPREFFELRDSLEVSWETGAPVAGLLSAAAARARDQMLAEAKARAGKLGVQVVLPLGLCFLPAFILLGIIPMLVHLGSGVLGS